MLEPTVSTHLIVSQSECLFDRVCLTPLLSADERFPVIFQSTQCWLQAVPFLSKTGLNI
jgi:hypothetical protein